jgi:2-dehydro-3-deoxyglucarate aldolase/4-hydroxy-2-oxoheptanedioate aldolase
MAESLRAQVTRRTLKAGHYIAEFFTPGIGHILKSAACDFVLLDMENSGIGFETIKSSLRYLEAADLPTIVRLPSKESHHITRACDLGAEGLMLPMVNSPEEAREIIKWMKFPPEGARGVALQIAHDRYRPGPVEDKLRSANGYTTLFAQIETVDAVSNIDAIASLAGVDCLWIGQFDLSASLGIPGNFSHPRFSEAVGHVVAAARRHNKALGRLVMNVEQGVQLRRSGFDFICYSGDVWLLQNALIAGLSELRELCKE